MSGNPRRATHAEIGRLGGWVSWASWMPTAADRIRPTVVISDHDDLQALLTNTVRAVPVLAV